MVLFVFVAGQALVAPLHLYGVGVMASKALFVAFGCMYTGPRLVAALATR